MKQLLFCLTAALSFHAAAANGPVNTDNKTKHTTSHQKTTSAKRFDCTGVNKKLINGVCETGVQVWTRSEWDSVNHWYRCYYIYRWSDGSESQEYFVINGAGCIA
jgi:hypothetical protein